MTTQGMPSEEESEDSGLLPLRPWRPGGHFLRSRIETSILPVFDRLFGRRHVIFIYLQSSCTWTHARQ